MQQQQQQQPLISKLIKVSRWSAANIVVYNMAKLLVLTTLMLGAVWVQGFSHHKAALKENLLKTEKRSEKNALRDILKDELENWRQVEEMEEEQLLELRQEASGDDSDDSDDSGEADESPEDDEDEETGRHADI